MGSIKSKKNSLFLIFVFVFCKFSKKKISVSVSLHYCLVPQNFTHTAPKTNFLTRSRVPCRCRHGSLVARSQLITPDGLFTLFGKLFLSSFYYYYYYAFFYFNFTCVHFWGPLGEFL